MIPYQHNITKYVATPANGKVMRRKLEERLKAMEDYSNAAEINCEEYNGTKVGVISSGVAYQYAKEVLKRRFLLKAGHDLSHANGKIRKFAASVEKLYVEEMDPYIENHLKWRVSRASEKKSSQNG
ncbi:hypothetical protein [Anoxybacterium hadale]|uniref:hypothetical protein n=1 Tax=Anoxybacterium hadale TaxID=3408580 RepID=UPI003AFFE55C